MYASNLVLPPDLHDFIASSIESGRFSNSNELMVAALRALQNQESRRKEESKPTPAFADDLHAGSEDDVLRKLWLVHQAGHGFLGGSSQ